MKSAYARLIDRASSNDSVTEEMFGINAIATVNMPQEDGVYDRLVDVLEPDHIRYPGGTVTERYFDPNGETWNEFISPDAASHTTLPDGQQIQSLRQVTDYAAAKNIEVKLVLPTEALLISKGGSERVPDIDLIDKMIADLKHFISEVPSATKIDLIEIGNEYYYDGRMSAAEYADLVNIIAPRLDQMFNEVADEVEWYAARHIPEIAAQTGAGWNPGDNQTILYTLTDEAKSTIDVAIAHFYPRHLEATDNFDRHMNGIQEWENDPLLAGVKYYVSEWNVQNTTSSDKGFFQASTLGKAFDKLLSYDVELASIWGTQYRSLDSRLSTLSERDSNDIDQTRIDTDLTATGELFLAMRESIVGLKSLRINPEFIAETSWEFEESDRPLPQILLTAFGSADRAFLIVSSREANDDSLVELNLDRLFEGQNFVSIRALVPIDNPTTTSIDEGDPTSAFARVDLEFLYTGPLSGAPDVFELPPGAILLVDVNVSGTGVELEGQNPISEEIFINDDDLINGSNFNDTISGHNGNDTLFGHGGADILFGGSGNDRIFGGDGNDLVVNHGDQTVSFGGGGDDVMVSSGVRTNINAGRGDDFVIDSSSQANIFGDLGNDTFLIFGDRSTSSGGDGEDLFYFGAKGHHTVKDFDHSSGDKIYLSSAFLEGRNPYEALESAEYSTSEAGDTIIKFGDHSTLVLEGVELNRASLESQLSFEPNDEVVAARVAGAFSSLSPKQVQAFSEGLGSEQLDGLLNAVDPQVLFEGVEPSKALHFALGLNPDELHDFLDEISSESIVAALTGLTDRQSIRILEDMETDQFSEILSAVGISGVSSWYDTLDTAGHVLISDHAALFGYRLDVRDIPDEEPSNDDHVPIIPQRPDDEPNPNEDDEDENANGIHADCFVACTVYRDVDHPEVWLLRWFRDMVMRKYLLGRVAVRAYWLFGPYLAKAVARGVVSQSFFYVSICWFVRIIAVLYGRNIGKQSDHVVWSQNEFKFIPLKPRYRSIKE